MTLTWATIDSFADNSTSAELVARRPCPLCGHRHDREVTRYERFQFYSDDATRPKRADVRTALCERCFAVFMNPCYSAEGFRTLFAEAGMSYGSNVPAHGGQQIAWLEQRGLLRDGAVLLDVGCYDGGLLSRLPKSVERIGVDIDEPAISRGRERHPDIAFVCGDFEHFESPRAPTAITMFHVLEHLPRPVQALERLRQVAAPGARLVVEVPVVENGATHDINGFFSVQHLTHFSRSSLRASVESAGWKIEEIHEQPDYNGCRVLACACDPVAVRTGDPEDVARIWGLRAGHFSALESAARRLQAVPRDARCVIWGGGAHTEVLYHVTPFFLASPERPLAIVDGDLLKHGRTWRGVAIHSPKVLAGQDWSGTWLLVSSYGSQESIARAARDLGVPDSRIVRIYDSVRSY